MKAALKTRFKVLKDGWIKDLSTGLYWGKSSANEMNFKDALAYCAKEGGAIPSRSQLESIQDLNKHSPCIDEIFKDTKSSYYWSNTPYVPYKNSFWIVSFHYGNVYGSCEGYDSYVRPVRVSQ